MTRTNGRKLACLPREAPGRSAAPAAKQRARAAAAPDSPSSAAPPEGKTKGGGHEPSLKSSGVVTSRTVRRIKEMMAFDSEPWREGEESVWPMLEGCLATMSEHDGEPTEEQARREDAFAYLIEVLRNQEEDAASAGDDEEAAAREMSDIWS